jgi:hypothetical protein
MADERVNPFRPAEQVEAKAKCLIYGPPGGGKTHLGLTSPGRVAVIDTEGGTAFFAARVGRYSLHPFDVLPTKTFAEVEAAVDYLGSNPGLYETLLIDPVTVLYETLQDAAQMRRKETNRRKGGGREVDDPDLEQLDWQRIKRSYKRLMTDLVNLPMHVMVTAREREVTEERGDRRVHVGWKPDAEKSTAYYFDIVLRMIEAKGRGHQGRQVTVEKDRTGTLPLGTVIPAPTFRKVFGRALRIEGTAQRGLQQGEEAAQIDSTTTMVTAELEDEQEMTTPIGVITRTGTVARGKGRRSNLELRRTQDGWHAGFRLELDNGKAIPQVVAQGEFGTALYHQVEDFESLLGDRVTVTGQLYEVHPPPPKGKYHRLILSRIEGEGWSVPAPQAVPDIGQDDDFDPAESARIDVAEATKEGQPS